MCILKMIFLHEKILFFDDIFFKDHLLVEKNRFEAVSERWQFKVAYYIGYIGFPIIPSVRSVLEVVSSYIYLLS